MPHLMRVKHPGTICHVMSLGHRRQRGFLDEVDRQDFLKALAETSRKSGWQTHVWRLMGDDSRVLAQTPEADLAARLREETALPIASLVKRLQMGTRQTLNAALSLRGKDHAYVNSTACPL